MTVKEIASVLEERAPLAFAEEFDNVGLLVGDPSMEVTGILVTLDTLEAVVEEAVAKNCNLVVGFHPILFKGLKRLTGATYVERAVALAIRHQVALYSMHTALDNVRQGVNGKICEVLGLRSTRILIPKQGMIKKLVTYVPRGQKDALLEKLFDAGAGQIGDYSHCSFSLEGTGSFLPSAQANPAVGQPGALHLEPEAQLHLTFTADREPAVLQALFAHHPYEEVAYEVTPLSNAHQHLGMGMVGELESPLPAPAFLQVVRERFGTPCIRHSRLPDTPVSKVAVLGGSGAFAIDAARAAGADILLTGDVKYHDFFRAGDQMVVADIGHYESEQFTKNLLADYLTEKIPNFAISLSETKTNPINYF